MVEKFYHTVGSKKLDYQKTFDGNKDNLYHCPNDIFAVPGKDKESAFYVTNDHYYKEPGFLREFEMLGRLPWSQIVYHSDKTGDRIVAKGLQSANGKGDSLFSGCAR